MIIYHCFHVYTNSFNKDRLSAHSHQRPPPDVYLHHGVVHPVRYVVCGGCWLRCPSQGGDVGSDQLSGEQTSQLLPLTQRASTGDRGVAGTEEAGHGGWQGQLGARGTIIGDRHSGQMTLNTFVHYLKRVHQGRGRQNTLTMCSVTFFAAR